MTLALLYMAGVPLTVWYLRRLEFEEEFGAWQTALFALLWPLVFVSVLMAAASIAIMEWR